MNNIPLLRRKFIKRFYGRRGRQNGELMKKYLSGAFFLLLAALFIAVIPTDAEGMIYEDTVRLHILANSDSEEDQALKLALRDEVLNEYGRSLSFFECADEAKEALNAKQKEIESFCNAKLSELTENEYTARVTLTEEWYETRDYGEYSLPKGYYTSLRIIIGEGEGQNWWCVMFPPLCLNAATENTAYTPEEEFLITKKYRVKFKIIEIVSELTENWK